MCSDLRKGVGLGEYTQNWRRKLGSLAYGVCIYQSRERSIPTTLHLPPPTPYYITTLIVIDHMLFLPSGFKLFKLNQSCYINFTLGVCDLRDETVLFYASLTHTHTIIGCESRNGKKKERETFF